VRKAAGQRVGARFSGPSKSRTGEGRECADVTSEPNSVDYSRSARDDGRHVLRVPKNTRRLVAGAHSQRICRPSTTDRIANSPSRAHVTVGNVDEVRARWRGAFRSRRSSFCASADVPLKALRMRAAGGSVSLRASPTTSTARTRRRERHSSMISATSPCNRGRSCCPSPVSASRTDFPRTRIEDPIECR